MRKPAPTAEVVYLRMGEVRVDFAWNCRQAAEDPAEWASFVQSIRDKGLDTPMTVRQVGGGWWLTIGYRRYRALSEIHGDRFPRLRLLFMVGSSSEKQAKIDNLVENVQRKSLHPWEMAQTLHAMRADGHSAKELAELTGLTEVHVTNLIRLKSKLCEPLWELYCTPGSRATYEKLIAVVVHPKHEQPAEWDKLMKLAETEKSVKKRRRHRKVAGLAASREQVDAWLASLSKERTPWAHGASAALEAVITGVLERSE